MTRRPAQVTQAEIQNAIQAAKKAGAHAVMVTRNGVDTVVWKNDGTETPQAVVYFIKCGEFVKIGTTFDLNARRKAMLTDNPFELELLFTKQGSVPKEKAFHAQFAQYRHRREWFRIEGTLKDWIEENAKDSAD